MKGLSLSQVQKRFGFNARHVYTLLQEEVLTILPGCTPLRPRVDPHSLSCLREGTHYVVCLECGSWVAQMTARHLKACSGLTLASYRGEHPGAPEMCDLTRSNKAKTEAQKRAQSEKLKARFQTSEGEETRRQISEASKKRAPQLREVLAEIRERPEVKAAYRERAEREWREGGPLVRGVACWHAENRDQNLAQLEEARGNLSEEQRRKNLSAQHRTSKMHLKFKGRMRSAGLEGFVTEGRVGPFEIDELHSEAGLAVEIDGCYWHGCLECGFEGVPSTVANDKRKDAYLKAAGFRVLRIPGHLVRSTPELALQQIQENLR